MGQEANYYTIADDGSIEKKVSGKVSDKCEQMCLNTIRIGAQRNSIMAAYNARKKCYEIAKQHGHGLDFEEYVQGLQLDHYPVEFKKAEIGASYRQWRNICMSLICISISGGVVAYYYYVNWVLVDMMHNLIVLSVGLFIISVLLLCITAFIKRKRIKELF